MAFVYDIDRQVTYLDLKRGEYYVDRIELHPVIHERKKC